MSATPFASVADAAGLEAPWRVAVLIPAYNEADTLAQIVYRTRQQLAWVIVVDDGSTDASAALAEAAGAQVLRQPSNQGKGAALWRGMQYALAQGATVVITLDADGQHQPEEIPNLLRAYRQQPDRLIIAARLKQRTAVPWVRRLANRIADFWISWAAGCPITDTQSGFRLYPAPWLRQVTEVSSQRPGFEFESALLIMAGCQHRYPQSVPITALYPVQARPSYYRPWRDTWRITRMVADSLLRRGLNPLGLLRSLRLLPLVTAPHTDKVILPNEGIAPGDGARPVRKSPTTPGRS